MASSLNDTSAAPRRGLAIASLIIGLISVPTFGLLVVGGLVAVLLGIVALMKIKKEPAAYGGTGFAIGGIVAGAASLALIPVMGIIAGVVVPSLSRAAIAGNEAGTIGRMRAIVSGEQVYAASNGNAYDTLECLAAPSSCGFDASVPAFISPDLLQETASGYRITFVKGAAADRTVNTAARSPSSLEAFAVVAQPERPGVTGNRVFCTDATGVFRVAPESAAPGAIAGGACPADWPELQ